MRFLHNVEQLSPIVLFLAMVGLSGVQNNWGQLFYIAVFGLCKSLWTCRSFVRLYGYGLNQSFERVQRPQPAC